MTARRAATSGRQQAVDGQFGPVARGRASRRARWSFGRVAFLCVAVVAVVALVAGGTMGWVLWYGAQQVGRIDVDHLRQAGDVDGNGTVDVEELGEVLTILVVGNDSREGLTEDQLVALGTDREAGSRADTIMLVQLDPRRDQAALLSFPRDLMVTRCDGSEGRINAAYNIGEREGTGGPTCLVRTITDFTGIPINHYVEVDFAGFIEIVEAIGGVTLYLDEPLVDPYAGLDLPAGCVDLDGKAALGFVRTRHIDSDFGRIARQQRFVREVVAEAVSVGTLVNLPRLLSLVDAVGKAVDADQELTGGHMRRIAMSLRSMDADSIDMRTVPGQARLIGGAWYVVPDTDAAEPLFAAFRESRDAPDDVGREVAGTEQEPVGVAEVPALTVLNGVGEAGLGARAAAALRESGFSVGAVSNADHYGHERTVVTYPPGLEEHAAVVAEALGGAELEAAAGGDQPGAPAAVTSDGGEVLTVVLGHDYELPDASAAAQRDAPRTTASPSPTAAASPAPTATAPAVPYQAATPAEHRC